jgi:hypothetical protein
MEVVIFVLVNGHVGLPIMLSIELGMLIVF